jgi:hypothetical protein
MEFLCSSKAEGNGPECTITNKEVIPPRKKSLDLSFLPSLNLLLAWSKFPTTACGILCGAPNPLSKVTSIQRFLVPNWFKNPVLTGYRAVRTFYIWK